MENWWRKEVIEACNRYDGENRGCKKAAHEGEQHDDNQIGESCCGEVEPKAEASQGHQCQRNAAEEALGDPTPEMRFPIAIYLHWTPREISGGWAVFSASAMIFRAQMAAPYSRTTGRSAQPETSRSNNNRAATGRAPLCQYRTAQISRARVCDAAPIN